MSICFACIDRESLELWAHRIDMFTYQVLIE